MATLPTRPIRYRLRHTIPEAMVLLGVSNRTKFIEKYIKTGLVGLIDEPGEPLRVPRADLEAVVLSQTSRVTNIHKQI